MGIEPTFLAWEATFLPLEDTRRVDIVRVRLTRRQYIGATHLPHLLCNREAAC